MPWRGGGAHRIVPGSGATSLGAALRGALKSICVGSSSEGAILYAKAKVQGVVATWLCLGEREGSLLINGHHRAEIA
jgi:hypothetical protein